MMFGTQYALVYASSVSLPDSIIAERVLFGADFAKLIFLFGLIGGISVVLPLLDGCGKSSASGCGDCLRPAVE